MARAGDADTGFLCLNGDVDVFLTELLEYECMFALDGDNDTLLPGDKGGCSHVARALGVLGVL
jgi:hypothetical protein